MGPCPWQVLVVASEVGPKAKAGMLGVGWWPRTGAWNRWRCHVESMRGSGCGNARGFGRSARHVDGSPPATPVSARPHAVVATRGPCGISPWISMPTASTARTSTLGSLTYNARRKTTFHAGSGSLSLFLIYFHKARIFSHASLPSPQTPHLYPNQVVDANPGVPAHSAYPQHQR